MCSVFSILDVIGFAFGMLLNMAQTFFLENW
jgi:hypothetical protein